MIAARRVSTMRRRIVVGCMAVLLGCGPQGHRSKEAPDFKELAKAALSEPGTWWIPTTNDQIVLVDLANSQYKAPEKSLLGQAACQETICLIEPAIPMPC
jgi:hypothetical protein